jgi:hypothetical protein
MTEQVTPQSTDTEVKTVDNPGDKNNSTPESIPYSRFAEVVKAKNDANARITALEANVAEYNKDKQDRLDEKSIANGEFAQMADRYKIENAQLKEANEAFKANADVIATYELEQRAVLTGKLPEAKQPFAVNMSLNDLAKFVELEVATQVTPREDNAPGERFGGYNDIMEFAQRDPKGYMKAKAAGAFKQ